MNLSTLLTSYDHYTINSTLSLEVVKHMAKTSSFTLVNTLEERAEVKLYFAIAMEDKTILAVGTDCIEYDLKTGLSTCLFSNLDRETGFVSKFRDLILSLSRSGSYLRSRLNKNWVYRLRELEWISHEPGLYIKQIKSSIYYIDRKKNLVKMDWKEVYDSLSPEDLLSASTESEDIQNVRKIIIRLKPKRKNIMVWFRMSKILTLIALKRPC